MEAVEVLLSRKGLKISLREKCNKQLTPFATACEAGTVAVEVIRYMIETHATGYGATGTFSEGVQESIKAYFRALVFREEYPRQGVVVSCVLSPTERQLQPGVFQD